MMKSKRHRDAFVACAENWEQDECAQRNMTTADEPGLSIRKKVLFLAVIALLSATAPAARRCSPQPATPRLW